MRRGTLWWLLASAVLMIIGAFGPWVTAFSISVAGTDGSNDGWVVVAAAGVGAGLCYAARASRAAGVWALLGGIVGFAVTVYDRGHVQTAINRGGAFAQALAHVGWGLNLALVASISMALAGVAVLLQGGSSSEVLGSERPGSGQQRVALDRPEAAVARMEDAEAAFQQARFGAALSILFDEVYEASRRRDAEHLGAVKALAEKIERAPVSQQRDRAKAARLIQTADEAMASIEPRREELTAAEAQAKASTNEAGAEAEPVVAPASPLDIVQERYARGEITREEFQQLKSDLAD
jgi:hypothetical protein